MLRYHCDWCGKVIEPKVVEKIDDTEFKESRPYGEVKLLQTKNRPDGKKELSTIMHDELCQTCFEWANGQLDVAKKTVKQSD